MEWNSPKLEAFNRTIVLADKSKSLSNTLFPITRRVSLYLELISGKRGERISIIVMVALCAIHYSTRAEIFGKFVMRFLRLPWRVSISNYCIVLIFFIRSWAGISGWITSEPAISKCKCCVYANYTQQIKLSGLHKILIFNFYELTFWHIKISLRFVFIIICFHHESLFSHHVDTTFL